MRVVLVAAVLMLAACGGHRIAAPARCTLSLAEGPVPETGEHSLAVRSSCVVPPHPKVSLEGIPFTYVFEGGAKSAHTVVFDKYRCDVRYRAIAHEVRVGGAELRTKRSLMDWCPGEAVSTVVHVYRGGLRRTPASWHGVLRDVYDGRLDRVWTCAALREAIRHLPVDGPTYSPIGGILGRAAAGACGSALAGMHAGSPRFAVEEAFGRPLYEGPRCGAWTWPPAGGSVDGVRVCFAHGRAATVQTAVHG